MSTVQLENVMFRTFKLYRINGTIQHVVHYYVTDYGEHKKIFTDSKKSIDLLFLRLRDSSNMKRTLFITIKIKLNNYTNVSLTFEFYKNNLSLMADTSNVDTPITKYCYSNRDILNLDIDDDIKKIIIDNLNLIEG